MTEINNTAQYCSELQKVVLFSERELTGGHHGGKVWGGRVVPTGGRVWRPDNFLPRDALSAKRGIAIACRPSVCLSVRL